MDHFYSNLNQVGKSGKINLINLEEHMPQLLRSMQDSRSRDMTDWQKIGIEHKRLSAFYGRLTQESIQTCLDENSDLGFFKTLKRCPEAEKCRYNYTYLTTFSSLCARILRLPTVEEFWRYWVHMNMDAIQTELKTDAGYSALNSIVERTGKSEIESKRMFKDGLELRAKRFYCAAIRELDAMLSMASEIPDEYEGYKVFAHPLVDSICKYDAIVLTPDRKAIAVAICLESTESANNVLRKANEIPTYFKPTVDMAIGFDISMKSHYPGITIASDQEKYRCKLALQGDPATIRRMNPQYTWKNSF